MAKKGRRSLGRICPDCYVSVGQKHNVDCDVARCLATGEQRLAHLPLAEAALVEGFGVIVGIHDCGQDTWTGEHRGAAECREFGWWCRPATAGDAPIAGWIPCPEGTPGAALDLTRLYRHATWDRDTGRWHLP